uniref:Myelin-oligodendrocyte glycoprotein-like n=1 Tax=Haplochromis burtoni TaxID=8153 RepID=A0A3Q2W1E7_HAPBU
MCVNKSHFEDSFFPFPLWTLILCSAFIVRTPVQGEVLVIGSNLPIIAAPGDDVILPCHLEPMFDVQGMTVEWSKPDLKPDPSDRLSRVEYVHLYRDRKEVPDMKMASYFRRTELFMDDMKHGNISLKILNVSEEDNGRYRCFIPKLQSRVKPAVVELLVGEKICFGTFLFSTHFQTFM